MYDIKILQNTIQIKKRKILIAFDDMITNMQNNEKLNKIVKELFIRGTKLKISLVFIMQSYFKAPKDVRVNTMQIFIRKITNKELQQIVHNHSSDIDFKDFRNLCKKCTAKPHSFLVIDDTLASDNPSRFRSNLL